MHPVVALRGIGVVRNGIEILRDIDLDIQSGEHWALLGPNGSGKTTLLNVLLTYVSPTRGSIHLLGREHGRADWRQLRRRIGLVSAYLERELSGADTALDIVYSGHEAMWGRFGAHQPAVVERAQQLLDQVAAANVADRAFRLLSQGERQRVLVARALMADPDLLILDEPCAGLDPIARETFLTAVSATMKTAGSTTVLFVSHHIEEIPPELSHVLLLKNGTTFARGPKRELLNSATLSSLFDTQVEVREQLGRYQLNVRLK